jgi:SAM-dependent methyltransferase
MRDNVKTFVSCCSHVFNPQEPIVEIGSLQVEGQMGYADLRPFFQGKKYIGCDMREGPGVDRIENVENMTLGDESVGCIIIVDTLEHIRNPHKALDEIHRVIKSDGMVIMTAPQNFPIHDYPYDYWRFTSEGFNLLLEKFSTRIICTQGNHMNPHTVFGIGFKTDISESLFEDFSARFLNELLLELPKGIRFKLSKACRTILRRIYSEELEFNLYKNNMCVKSIKEYIKG